MICCFHPILVIWFLVVFGDQVTKILHNSLFIFYCFSFSSCLANGKHHTENNATYFHIFITLWAKTKNEKWNEKNIYVCARQRNF